LLNAGHARWDPGKIVLVTVKVATGYGCTSTAGGQTPSDKALAVSVIPAIMRST